MKRLYSAWSQRKVVHKFNVPLGMIDNLDDSRPSDFKTRLMLVQKKKKQPL